MSERWSKLAVTGAVLRGIMWGLRRDDASRVMTLARYAVKLSPTTYRIRSPITLRSNQTLRGASSTLDASGLGGEAAICTSGRNVGIEDLRIVSAPTAFRVETTR